MKHFSLLLLLFGFQQAFSQTETPVRDTIPVIVVEVEDGLEGFLNVEREPQPINMQEVAYLIGYPSKAKRKGIQGTVIVRILVSESGEYLEHKVVMASDPILQKAVESKIHKLKFTPAISDGNPIKFYVNLPFNFRL